ncbi:FAD binding domain-containing protein [Thozetella sp. PMI_491]|nr:FAD binding domain-containing protein [Thozetella sp. PMI_491]
MASKVAATGAAVLLALTSLASAASENITSQTSGPSSNLKGCSTLINAGLGAQLFFPEDAEYTATLTSYYSQDVADVSPWCVFKPENVEQVAAGIKALAADCGNGWAAAIRSGGHSPSPTAANIAEGVTIDLGNLDSIKVSNCGSNSSYVAVGTGARWSSVYAALEPLGLMSVGGRAPHVGVGGFLLGGGFSWYSGKVGLSADNVIAYEVVLANGNIVRASAKQNPDLFKVLKGGWNNVGLVTKFYIRTFASHDVYGGIQAFLSDQRDVVLQKYTTMVDNMPTVKSENGFVSFSWTHGSGSTVALITANVDGEANSPSFIGLGNLTSLIDTRTTMPYTSLINLLTSTTVEYNVWYTSSFFNTIDMGNKVLEVMDKTVAELDAQVDEAVNVIFLLTPLPKTYGDAPNNIFGLEGRTQNANVMQVEALLPSSKWEKLVSEKLGAATAEIEAYAKSSGQDVPFRYINYANQDQDPLSSYGKENVDLLRAASLKYDPSQFFQVRIPGGFKVYDI